MWGRRFRGGWVITAALAVTTGALALSSTLGSAHPPHASAAMVLAHHCRAGEAAGAVILSTSSLATLDNSASCPPAKWTPMAATAYLDRLEARMIDDVDPGEAPISLRRSDVQEKLAVARAFLRDHRRGLAAANGPATDGGGAWVRGGPATDGGGAWVRGGPATDGGGAWVRGGPATDGGGAWVRGGPPSVSAHVTWLVIAVVAAADLALFMAAFRSTVEPLLGTGGFVALLLGVVLAAVVAMLTVWRQRSGLHQLGFRLSTGRRARRGLELELERRELELAASVPGPDRPLASRWPERAAGTDRVRAIRSRWRMNWQEARGYCWDHVSTPRRVLSIAG